MSLIRDAKNSFYENLNPKLITDNRKFWGQVNPFFSNKTPKCNNITLIEKNEIINDNSACAEILSNCFSDVVKELDIVRTIHMTSPVVAHSPVETYIEMFETHPSIIKIIELGIAANNFCFKPTSDDNIHEIIKNIDSSKAYQRNNIPPIIKDNTDICVVIMRSDLNICIEKGIFPSNLKNADITPLFKKLDRLLKSNYRPVSILPTLSKIYEKLLYRQIYEYFDIIFSKYLSGFRKGHSTQHCLLFMLEKLKKALDNGLCIGILCLYLHLYISSFILVHS